MDIVHIFAFHSINHRNEILLIYIKFNVQLKHLTLGLSKRRND